MATSVLIPPVWQRFTDGIAEISFPDNLSGDAASKELVAFGIPYAAAKSFGRAARCESK